MLDKPTDRKSVPALQLKLSLKESKTVAGRIESKGKLRDGDGDGDESHSNQLYPISFSHFTPKETSGLQIQC